MNFSTKLSGYTAYCKSLICLKPNPLLQVLIKLRLSTQRLIRSENTVVYSKHICFLYLTPTSEHLIYKKNENTCFQKQIMESKIHALYPSVAFRYVYICVNVCLGLLTKKLNVSSFSSSPVTVTSHAPKLIGSVCLSVCLTVHHTDALSHWRRSREPLCLSLFLFRPFSQPPPIPLLPYIRGHHSQGPTEFFGGSNKKRNY